MGQYLELKNLLKKHKIVVFHYNDTLLTGHLKVGGVDFADFDLMKFEKEARESVLTCLRHIFKSHAIPEMAINGKAIAYRGDVYGMTGSGYLQHLLRKNGVKHRLHGMIWIED